MSKQGQVIWVDLTIENTEQVRDFYANVIGWTPEGVEIEGYDDYNMNDADGKAVAGICHKTGINASIPSQWMVYFSVPDIEASLQTVTAKGGEIVVPMRGEVGSRMAIIRDPAGAVCALFETPP